jgi:hypothetical protein
MKCQKRPPLKIFAKKDPLRCRHTCRHCRWRHARMHARSNPKNHTCRHCRWRHACLHASSNPSLVLHVGMPSPRMAAGPTTTRWWRHPHAGVGPGGTCHVSGGLFDKKFHRWSFLAFHSRRWSFMSKIRFPCRPYNHHRNFGILPSTPKFEFYAHK